MGNDLTLHVSFLAISMPSSCMNHLNIWLQCFLGDPVVSWLACSKFQMWNLSLDMLFNKDVTLVCQVLKAVGMRCGVFEYCLLSRKTYHILLVNNWNVAGVVLGQENLIYCWGRQPGSGTHVGSMAWKPGGEGASIRACLLLAIEQEFPFLRFWAAAKRGTGWML